jgi:hypothetical protein
MSQAVSGVRPTLGPERARLAARFRSSTSRNPRQQSTISTTSQIQTGPDGPDEITRQTRVFSWI